MQFRDVISDRIPNDTHIDAGIPVDNSVAEAVDRHPCSSYFLFNFGTGFMLRNVNQVDRYLQGGTDAFQEPEELKPPQAAVHQDVNVAVDVGRTLCIRAKQNRAADTVLGKYRTQNRS